MINISELIRSQIRAALGRRAFIAAFYIVAIAIAMFAFAFWLMAAQSWLSEWYQSPIKADLTVAGILTLLAVIAAIAGNAVQRAPSTQTRSPSGVAIALPLAARLAPRLLNRKAIGIASMVLGVVLIGREFGGKR